MRYLLHRISHEGGVSYPLLKEGFLTIGFSDFAGQSFIDNVRCSNDCSENWRAFEREMRQTWGEGHRVRHVLWRFIEGLNKGDTVLVPMNGTFSLYEIIGQAPKPIDQLPDTALSTDAEILHTSDGKLFYDDNSLIDLGFFWEVKPIETGISRYAYADRALTARMKVRQTNVWINDLKDNVIAALDAYLKNKPINIGNEIVKGTTPTILKLIKNKLTPDKFEHLVKYYFERIGATSVDIPPKNETDKKGDADVVAVFEGIKVIVYAQVKYHIGETDGGWATKQIIDYVKSKEEDNPEDSYTRVKWVISVADKFNEVSEALAREQGVQMINGPEFAKMLLEAGILNLSDTL